MATYTVQKGDTLTSISKKYYQDSGYSDYTSYMNYLVDINNIENKDLIYVGQVLNLDGDKVVINTDPHNIGSNAYYLGVTVTHFGLQSNTDRTVFVNWAWDRASKTEYYEVEWSYLDSTTKVWRVAEETTTNSGNVKYSVYDAPDNAEAAKVRVRPISKKYTYTAGGVTRTDEPYFYGVAWCQEQVYYFKNNPPKKPHAPSASIDKDTLKCELTDIDVFEADSEGIRRIQFWVTKIDTTYDANDEAVQTFTDFDDHACTLIINRISWSFKVDAGYDYIVKCRGVLADPDGAWTTYGDWSDYSDEVSALPTSPEIVRANVVSETTFSVTFKKVGSAKSYKFQLIKKSDVENSGLSKEEYFNTIGATINEKVLDSDKVTEKEGQLTTEAIQLSSSSSNVEGDVYYIRMCSNNGTDDSEYSNIETFIIGTTPESPTTWSSTTSAVTGEPLKLYWLHNSKDSSVSNSAILALKIYDENNNVMYPTDGELEFKEFKIEHNSPNFASSFIVGGSTLITITKSDPDNKDDNTFVCDVNTSHPLFSGGYSIDWKVKTAGVKTDNSGSLVYSKEYSAVRTVDIYTTPRFSVMRLEKKKTDGTYENLSNISLTAFPLHVIAELYPMTNQTPTGYYLNIIFKSHRTGGHACMTVDDLGNTKVITRGTKVFSKYYNYTTETFDEEIYPGDVDLVDGAIYEVVLTASMDSGLTASRTKEFSVAWIEQLPRPLAQVYIDPNTISASIVPYIELPEGDDEPVRFSVYRREYNGSYTKITNVEVENYVNVKDPHPALDYARYRVVARSYNTGAISYTDLAGVPTGESSIVIQWDEKWQEYDNTSGDMMSIQPWTGSLLRLPYNITISKSHDPDTSLVKYIGRKRPVGYYGTQLGETDTWSVSIPKDDIQTLYGIRRLASWMGDVYVREPSGLGYWANIKVSYTTKYNDLTIPITFTVTPVEGGM